MFTLRHIFQRGARLPYLAAGRINSVGIVRANRDRAARLLSSATSAAVERIKVSEDKKSLSLLLEGGQEYIYHSVWLRHMCRCASCLLLYLIVQQSACGCNGYTYYIEWGIQIITASWLEWVVFLTCMCCFKNLIVVHLWLRKKHTVAFTLSAGQQLVLLIIRFIYSSH